jgi:cytochrome c-type biogenesis protein CcmE
VEGQWTREGYFKATLILAKHSEEYQAPHPTKDGGDGAPAPPRRLLETLEKESR